MNSEHSAQPADASSSVVKDEPLIVTATLEHIFVSPGHDYWVKRPEGMPPQGIRDVPHIRAVQGRGLEGDRYFHGKANQAGQVTFLEAEVIDLIRQHFDLPELSAAVFRRNLIVRGMRLRPLMGKQFIFQGVRFEGSQECKPCIWMDRAVAQGVQAFMREPFRGGLRARILTSGELHADQSAE